MTFSFRLQRMDGSPADPPTYRSGVLSWQQGDTIPLNAMWTRRRRPVAIARKKRCEIPQKGSD